MKEERKQEFETCFLRFLIEGELFGRGVCFWFVLFSGVLISCDARSEKKGRMETPEAEEQCRGALLVLLYLAFAFLEQWGTLRDLWGGERGYRCTITIFGVVLNLGWRR